MATQQEIDNAKIKMDNAYSLIAPAKASMDSWYNLMTKCKIKDNDKYLVLGEPAEGTCQTGSASNHPGCADKSTCEGNMAQYNISVSNWENANTNYENAKDEYDELKGNKSDADLDANISKIEQDAKAIRTRYYVFGGIVLILIIAGIFIWIKTKK